MSDYCTETKCPVKPCEIQVCDRDEFGPIIVEETGLIWDDASYAFCLAIRVNQATFTPGRFVQTVEQKGNVL
jgi:hypothetical protein